MRRVLFTLLASLGLLLIAGNSMAGANLPINDNASLNLGYRIQPQLILTQDNLEVQDPDELEDVRYFKVRRARFRLGAKVGDHMTAFLQTDASNKDVQMIDAWVNFKVSPWLQFIMGRNMAPANRQNLTSSGALMTIDRPGIAYKSLTWGARSRAAFTNSAAPFTGGVDGDGDPALSTSPDAVRDNGLTIFGSGALGSKGTSNLKYYAGIYNGVQGGVDDKDRYTFRVQYNLWDAEPGYYNSSTYLGSKKTLGIGVSYDMQQEVAASGNPADQNKPLADYTYMAADVFFEWPMSSGNALTVEGGYMMLDFDDAAYFMNTQGNGFYAQAGFYITSGWQPWVEFENWSSDANEGENGTPGKFTNFRVGVTYFLEGQGANIKLGYESYKSDVPFLGEEDKVDTFLLGFYTTY